MGCLVPFGSALSVLLGPSAGECVDNIVNALAPCTLIVIVTKYSVQKKKKKQLASHMAPYGACVQSTNRRSAVSKEQ